MNDDQLIRPLKDVWLRPRRVFRGLASQPLGPADYVLAAMQGICNYLLYMQLQPPNSPLPLPVLLSNALLYGSFTGLLATGCYAVIYVQIAARLGRPLARAAAFHVLSYGAVPVAAALLLSAGRLLLAGETVPAPQAAADVDAFVWIVAHVQLTLLVLLYLWSYLLQVMGFSELFRVTVRRAFGLWMLGQLLGALAALLLDLFLTVLSQTLSPGG